VALLVFCTLLGPEGPGSTLVGTETYGPCYLAWDLLFGVVVWGGRYRPYFENYTVDASILDKDREVFIT
jgi:hypothetical protein